MARKPLDTRVWATTIDKAAIDAEPKRQRGWYPAGKQAWFIHENRWFLVDVVRNTQHENRMTIKSATGWDADHTLEWPFGELLDFRIPPRQKESGLGLYHRMRPLTARRP